MKLARVQAKQRKVFHMQLVSCYRCDLVQAVDGELKVYGVFTVSITGTTSPGTMFGGMQNMVPNPMYANIGMQPSFWGTQGQFGMSQGNLGMAGFSIPPVNMAPRHHHVTGQGVQMAPTGDAPDDGEPDEQPEVEENEGILVPEHILAHKDTKNKEGAPLPLVSFVGKQQYVKSAKDIYYFLQSPVFLKQLVFGILEILLITIFPEMTSLVLDIRIQVADIDLTLVLMDKQKAEEQRHQFPENFFESNEGGRPVSFNGQPKDNTPVQAPTDTGQTKNFEEQKSSSSTSIANIEEEFMNTAAMIVILQQKSKLIRRLKQWKKERVACQIDYYQMIKKKIVKELKARLVYFRARMRFWKRHMHVLVKHTNALLQHSIEASKKPEKDIKNLATNENTYRKIGEILFEAKVKANQPEPVEWLATVSHCHKLARARVTRDRKTLYCPDTKEWLKMTLYEQQMIVQEPKVSEQTAIYRVIEKQTAAKAMEATTSTQQSVKAKEKKPSNKGKGKNNQYWILRSDNCHYRDTEYCY
ncbi:hypothetical protein L7F22_006472 [Adiantum nelumboides]|nr:hypothetical protein [Adiantum nelumboides]